MNYVIGCDVGSQSLKVLLISEQGQTCGEASISYPIDYPQPAWAEQSAICGWMRWQAVRVAGKDRGLFTRYIGWV
jgi:sugar (pentulose or hexulose) kinase